MDLHGTIMNIPVTMKVEDFPSRSHWIVYKEGHRSARHAAAELALAEDSKDQTTWIIEDHLCSGCGGRILRSASGAGPTPGGNPLFKCADCGKTNSAMTPGILCWCGFSHRGNYNSTAYLCKPFSILKDRPELESAFKACGCDPKRGEVGILLEKDFYPPKPVTS
jgi:DNA-directed RNA polymerase subunit RPC12/RpoP